MRDKIVWKLASYILSFGTKKYQEQLIAMGMAGREVLKDPELTELVLDKLKSS